MAPNRFPHGDGWDPLGLGFLKEAPAGHAENWDVRAIPEAGPAVHGGIPVVAGKGHTSSNCEP